MHGKVDCMKVFDTFKIPLALPGEKTAKFKVLISVLSKIDQNGQIESYKASVTSKPHSIQMAAINYQLYNEKVTNGCSPI